jgi:hypothetical protein
MSEKLKRPRPVRCTALLGVAGAFIVGVTLLGGIVDCSAAIPISSKLREQSLLSERRDVNESSHLRSGDEVNIEVPDSGWLLGKISLGLSLFECGVPFGGRDLNGQFSNLVFASGYPVSPIRNDVSDSGNASTEEGRHSANAPYEVTSSSVDLHELRIYGIKVAVICGLGFGLFFGLLQLAARRIFT